MTKTSSTTKIISRVKDDHFQDLKESMEGVKESDIIPTGRILYANKTLWVELVSSGIKGWFSSDFERNPLTDERIRYFHSTDSAIKFSFDKSIGHFPTKPGIRKSSAELSTKETEEFISMIESQISSVNGGLETNRVAIFDGQQTWVQVINPIE